MPRPNLRAVLEVAALPLIVLIAEVFLRVVAGPGWIWRHMDPDYFYLFDALNLLTGAPLTQIWHPGVPLTVFIAGVLAAMHPLSGGDEIARAALADPDGHLWVVGAALSGLTALAMLAAGLATRKTTASAPLAWVIQSGPLFALLTVQYGIRVKPEALLIIASLLTAALVMTALREDVLTRHRLRLAIGFGVVAGLAAAAKIVSAGLFGLIPILLLGSRRAVLMFWAAAAVATALFCLPAASEFGRILDWVAALATGSGPYGETAASATRVGVGEYLRQVGRMLSLPAVSVPLALSLVALGWGGERCRRGLPVRRPEWRALAGLTLAVVVHGFIVAKQPSGHYMIPAYVLGALMLALSLRILGDPAWWGIDRRRHVDRAVLGVVALTLVADAVVLGRAERDFRRFRDDNLAFGADAFSGCAQVFYYPASHPDYALLMGHYLSGYRYGEALTDRVSPQSYYLRDWFSWETPELRGLDGPVALKDIIAGNACTVLRGGQAERFAKILETQGAADLRFDAVCGSKYETAHVIGGTCPKNNGLDP